jgi:hypothetical protein
MSTLRVLVCHVRPSVGFVLPVECQVTDLTLCFESLSGVIHTVRSIVQPRLIALRLRVGSEIEADEIRLLSEAVASNDALRLLEVYDLSFRSSDLWDDDLDIAEPCTFEFAPLAPLLRLGHLKALVVHPVAFAIGDGDAEQMGRAWPKLQELRVSAQTGYGGVCNAAMQDACLSLRGLAVLVVQCPDLATITSFVNIPNAIPDCSDLYQHGRANTQLTKLSVNALAAFDVEEAGAFLISILVNLKVIGFHKTLDDSEECGEECNGCDRDYKEKQNACKKCSMELLPCYIASSRKQVEQGER